MPFSQHTMHDRLIIFTHVLHYKQGENLLAHGPYVNEINVLARRVSELVVVAPFVNRAQNISQDNIPYANTPRFMPLQVAGGNSWFDKLQYIWYGPRLLFQIAKGIRAPGILHLRAPGSIALMALLLMMVMGRNKRKFAKFAGEWDNPETSPSTFRWQRHWLAKRWLFNGPVFVYSSKPHARHVIPSFTSNLTEVDIHRANSFAQNKELKDRWVLVFAGRLVTNKGVDVLLEAMAEVNRTYRWWELLIMGDGTEKYQLQKQSTELGIADKVRWLGWCSPDTMNGYLAKAHIICQPTRFTESWGKVLQEGMAFGCIPVASAIGGLQRQLGDQPELLFEPGNATQCAAIISNIISGKYNYRELKKWSITQSGLYSLNSLADFTWNKYDEFYAS